MGLIYVQDLIDHEKDHVDAFFIIKK